MPTLMQKIRLAIHGWKRRREEADRAFLSRNAAWGNAAPPSAATLRVKPASAAKVDLEGLQVAYLDDSGQIDYYLDTESGDVVEVRDSARNDRMPAYFHRVPVRTAQSESEDRRAFVTSLESPAAQAKLIALTGDGGAFRKAIAEDRTVERAWYNFKNDRANAVIVSWLGGLRIGN
ncbi:MAG: hypothetical protein ABI837_09175 [Acidobacteriota bacterium]